LLSYLSLDSVLSSCNLGVVSLIEMNNS
jgi:hypothetical protein